ncbi:cytidine deaminase [Brumicola nitratireducens]|uniref:Cytidine deaminase n=1 Tax=Glaciecola nitratireducens (strain JCM 12485 / KCTC 12276 / FR1064) TaxID=1085623 RepID=G4QJI1_GLANF|nr:cytidine deaminase [Glaciecola nitratireducens]AEP28587.1 cytidine deaminase [Glaciecola nitratireducens FR1064]
MLNKQEIMQGLTQHLGYSHSPYSGVQVVAAIVYETNGEERVAYGVNIENVSYGLTVCAERSAISAAVIDGMQSIKALYVMSNQSDPISPCGACRQVVTEFMQDPVAPVLCVNKALNKSWESTLGELLPNRFDLG